MHHMRTLFLLGFNIFVTFAHSATSSKTTDELTQATHHLTLAPTEINQPIIINGHTLNNVASNVSKKDILEKRAEIMTALINLIDYAFIFYGGIDLGLADIPFNSETTDREVFRKALKDSICILKDPAAIVVGLEEMDFYQSLTKKTEDIIHYLETTEEKIENKLVILERMKIRLEKEKLTRNALTKFMCISATEDFNMRLKLFRHATINSNTIAAQHFLSTQLQPKWIISSWDKLSETDQTEIQALSDCENIQFQYLRAYHIFNDAVLLPDEKMERLDTLGTEAGHDFAHIIKFNTIINNPESDINHENAIQNWITFIEKAVTLPLSRRFAFMPIERSSDSKNWPKAYKTALYTIAQQHSPDISEESSSLNILKVLTEHFQIVEAANHYLTEFLVLDCETNILGNEEKIAEINRIATLVPDAKQILVQAIITPQLGDSNSVFTNNITLGYHKKTPDERRQTLYELNNRKAMKYLAEAYRDALLADKLTPHELENAGIAEAVVFEVIAHQDTAPSDNTLLTQAVNVKNSEIPIDTATAIGYAVTIENTPLLVTHLGIPTRTSLPEAERTFGNIAKLHKHNVIALIRLAFDLDDTAQTALFAKPEDNDFSIIEKLFDYRIAQGNLPCGTDQTTMNRMLSDLLQYGFHVANTLKEQHSVPDFFHEQAQVNLQLPQIFN